MIIISPLLRIYRNFRLNLLVEKILKNWNINYKHKLSIEDQSIIKEIFYHKRYSSYFPFYKKCNILDIGAHKGFFALYAALNCSSDSKIICFEPSHHNYTILTENINLNGLSNVHAVNKGVLAKAGNVKLYLYSSANNSILKEYENIIDKRSQEPETIQVITLLQIIDTFKLEYIDFLKMDCEGSEYDILYNLESSLYAKIKVISLEFHDLKEPKKSGHSLAFFLTKQGFSIVEFSYIESISNIHSGHIIAINKDVDY
jgi:FkbM family methyltransferase